MAANGSHAAVKETAKYLLEEETKCNRRRRACVFVERARMLKL